MICTNKEMNELKQITERKNKLTNEQTKVLETTIESVNCIYVYVN